MTPLETGLRTDDISRYDTCPPWCATEHGTLDGEDDHLHTGADLHLVDGLTARLASFIDPDSGVADGPYIIVGSTEWTPEQIRHMAKALLALADAAARSADTMSRHLHVAERGKQVGESEAVRN